MRLSEAPSYGKPIILYDKHCTGAAAYTALAKEFLKRQRAGETSVAPVAEPPAAPAVAAVEPAVPAAPASPAPPAPPAA